MSERSLVVRTSPVFGLLAAWCSLVVNGSILWALLHFFCGFFYLVYAGFVHSEVLVPYFQALLGF